MKFSLAKDKGSFYEIFPWARWANFYQHHMVFKNYDSNAKRKDSIHYRSYKRIHVCLIWWLKMKQNVHLCFFFNVEHIQTCGNLEVSLWPCTWQPLDSTWPGPSSLGAVCVALGAERCGHLAATWGHFKGLAREDWEGNGLLCPLILKCCPLGFGLK